MFFCLTLGPQRFHYTLDQRLRVAKFLGDQPNIHHWNFRITLGVAIDAMLPDENKRIREPIERNRQPAATRAHHHFVMLQLFAMLFKSAHRLESPNDLVYAYIRYRAQPVVATRGLVALVLGLRVARCGTIEFAISLLAAGAFA